MEQISEGTRMLYSKYGRLAMAILPAFVVVASFWPACSDDDSTGSGKIKPVPSAVTSSSCKNFAVRSITAVSSDQECIEYSRDGLGTLSIKHFNAAFNCCPDSFVVGVEIENGVITVVELDSLSHPCSCLCLYDIEYTINGIAPGTYTIDVIEKYFPSGPNNDPLRFPVDLKKTPSGSYCVFRGGYPWGLDYIIQD
jgi:hypothetical protein